MKKTLKLFLLFTILFQGTLIVYAEEKMEFSNTIENISNKTKAIISYKLKPHAENEPGVVNLPSNIQVKFENQEVEKHKITATGIIDFSETIFPTAGTYRYGLMQEMSSDENIVLSNAIYQIYVEVTRQEDGTLVKEVSPLVIDFENYEKSETIEFFNTTQYTSITIESRVDGTLKEYDQNTYFKYKISIMGPTGDHYKILGQDPIVSYEGQEIKTEKEYVVKENLEENYIYIYLKDKQKVTIGLTEESFKEIPVGTTYTIMKMGGEKWLTLIDEEEQNQKTYTTSMEEQEIIIINKRDYDSAITGVYFTIVPFIIVWMFVIIAIVFYPKMKRRKL